MRGPPNTCYEAGINQYNNTSCDSLTLFAFPLTLPLTFDRCICTEYRFSWQLSQHTTGGQIPDASKYTCTKDAYAHSCTTQYVHTKSR